LGLAGYQGEWDNSASMPTCRYQKLFWLLCIRQRSWRALHTLVSIFNVFIRTWNQPSSVTKIYRTALSIIPRVHCASSLISGSRLARHCSHHCRVCSIDPHMCIHKASVKSGFERPWLCSRMSTSSCYSMRRTSYSYYPLSTLARRGL